MKEFTISVRYCRTWTDPGVEHHERNLSYRQLQWTLPVEQTALVMVDVWKLHPNRSHGKRSMDITLKRIAPVLKACRSAGVTIIHAPAPHTAPKYEQWVRYADDADLGLAANAPRREWPPKDFCGRSGDYARFAKPVEPNYQKWQKDSVAQRIIPQVAPVASDFVISTGQQLQRLLHHRKVLHLLYVGFAANMCVLYRDYGTRAMIRHGYNVILLRDCTTAIEMAETYSQKRLTRAAVLDVELLGGFSTTSTLLLRALAKRRN